MGPLHEKWTLMTHVTEQTFRILANDIPGHGANRAVQKETSQILKDV